MRVPRQHHAVANREIAHVRANRRHFAGGFMAQYRGQLHRQRALDRFEIGMT